jgi:hypothetical protein
MDPKDYDMDDPEQAYQFVKEHDPLFNQVTRQMQKTMLDEGLTADKVTEINSNHETFNRAYAKIKSAYFNHVPEETVARSRAGGRDEWEALACAMGLDRLHEND